MSVTLTPKARTNANKKLANLCKNRLEAIPLKDICVILQEAGLDPIEDALYCGQTGRASHELTYKGQSVKNSLLILTWYKGERDNLVEVVSYLS